MESQRSGQRIQSIDLLRGLIMIVMALDHVRDFFSDFTYSPTDMEQASTVMFMTRWVTHFCAPIFIFLSGVSAYLSLRKISKANASRRLFIRGIWLIVLELTIIRFGWAFDLDYSTIFLQVIWAIGCSMIALAVLIYLPRAVILGLALIMIFGHNLLDGFHPHTMTSLWKILHVQAPIKYGHGNVVMVLYPLVPWVGVMALGFCFGKVFNMQEEKRHKIFYNAGFSAILLFLLLRAMNIYGEASPWDMQETWWRTILSFINCTKYPPSLLYLLMTLGPAIAILPILEKLSGKATDVVKVYGKVPLFYYILHIYLIHSLALISTIFVKGNVVVGLFPHPGYSLPWVYAIWALTIFILYWPCRWFMQIKLKRHNWWLSYL